MNKMIKQKFIFPILMTTSLLLVSPTVFAAEQVYWKSYLFIAMGISLIIASVLSKRNEKAESMMGKLLLTGLYFWVFTFAQLTVLALVYYFNK